MAGFLVSLIFPDELQRCDSQAEATIERMIAESFGNQLEPDVPFWLNSTTQ
jgi:hypothetical protein